MNFNGPWPVSSHGSSVLAYLDYSKPFILEMDASLKGLGAVLSQKWDDNEICVITYASQSLRPSEKSMGDYSSAKIELMALRWSVWDKFKDYLLRSKFTVFIDNNPLCYIKSSKLGAAQIRWLIELTLYNFDIVYHTGKSNLVTDTLSCRPEVEEEIKKETPPKSDDDEWIAVSYQVKEQGGCISSVEFNQAISKLVRGTKIDKKLKDRIDVMDIGKEKLDGKTIEVATGMVNLFDSIKPKEMAEFQNQDNQITPIITYVEQDQKPSKKFTYQIKSKLARKLALQWDRLILKQGVLHHLYIFNEIEYHQLVLPQQYHRKYLWLFTIIWAIKASTERWTYSEKEFTGLLWPRTPKIGSLTALVVKLLGVTIISPNQKSVIWRHTTLWTWSV